MLWLAIADIVGNPLSIVTLKPSDTSLTLPARSVLWAVMVFGPSGSAAEVIIQAPSEPTFASPTSVVPSRKIRTVLDTSPVPRNCGITMLVKLSVSDSPRSALAIKSGTDGVSGAVVSMVTLRVKDSSLELAATSAAVAIKNNSPSGSVVAV